MASTGNVGQQLIDRLLLFGAVTGRFDAVSDWHPGGTAGCPQAQGADFIKGVAAGGSVANPDRQVFQLLTPYFSA